MKLTDHFTLEELTFSETAKRHGLDNAPSQEVITNLRRLAETLEEVRILLWSKPIHVNSAYRSPQVNQMVGSKPTSDHLHGLAADFVCPAYGSPDDIIYTIVESKLPYKQVIREFDSWVHLSIPKEGEAPKKQALIIDRLGTRPYT